MAKKLQEEDDTLPHRKSQEIFPRNDPHGEYRRGIVFACFAYFVRTGQSAFGPCFWPARRAEWESWSGIIVALSLSARENPLWTDF